MSRSLQKRYRFHLQSVYTNSFSLQGKVAQRFFLFFILKCQFQSMRDILTENKCVLLLYLVSQMFGL